LSLIARLAIALAALADISVTGHGGHTITGPLLDWPALGVHLSPADIVLLGAAAIAAGIAWRHTGSK
jgi:hypothetical protein